MNKTIVISIQTLLLTIGLSYFFNFDWKYSFKSLFNGDVDNIAQKHFRSNEMILFKATEKYRELNIWTGLKTYNYLFKRNDKFFFFDDLFDLRPDQLQNLKKNIKAIIETNKQFKSRGADLKVLLIPGKEFFESSKNYILKDRTPLKRFHLKEAMTKLKNAGIDFIDPESSIKRYPLTYQKYDTHWTPKATDFYLKSLIESYSLSPTSEYSLLNWSNGNEDISQLHYQGVLDPQLFYPPKMERVARPQAGNETVCPKFHLISASYGKYDAKAILSQYVEEEVFHYMKIIDGTFHSMNSYLGTLFIDCSPNKAIWIIPEKYLWTLVPEKGFFSFNDNIRKQLAIMKPLNFQKGFKLKDRLTEKQIELKVPSREIIIKYSQPISSLIHLKANNAVKTLPVGDEAYVHFKFEKPVQNLDLIFENKHWLSHPKIDLNILEIFVISGKLSLN